jgi:hypothetical protein
MDQEGASRAAAPLRPTSSMTKTYSTTLPPACLTRSPAARAEPPVENFRGERSAQRVTIRRGGTGGDEVVNDEYSLPWLYSVALELEYVL